jgi:hypothetical protein
MSYQCHRSRAIAGYLRRRDQVRVALKTGNRIPRFRHHSGNKYRFIRLALHSSPQPKISYIMNMNNRRKPTQAESLGAGIVAGAVEGFITYPAEFVKTKAQFSRSAAGEVSRIIEPCRALKLNGTEAGGDINCQEHAQNWRSDCFVFRMWSFGCWKWSESWSTLHDLRLDQGAITRSRGESLRQGSKLTIRAS